MNSPEILTELNGLQHQGIPCCMATIVDGRGSIPQIVGAKAIFTQEGLRAGTVGGGSIEARCEETARELLDGPATAATLFRRWVLKRDLGMTCGGEVAVYFEVYRPENRWTVAVFGAGHVSQKLCRFLVELDCRVLCVDTRAEWLDKLPRKDIVEKLHLPDFVDGVDRIPPHAAVVVMTMGHRSDLPILRRLAETGANPPYLGVIGSGSKAAILRRELKESGVATPFIDRILCPIGEKLGNNTPGEIAVSIVTQLLQYRSLEQQATRPARLVPCPTP